MHRWTAITVALGVVLSAGMTWAQAERPSPQVLVLSAPSGERAAPTIVRGAPTERQAAPAAVAQDGGRWQIVAGERLWLVDRATAEVRSCVKRGTSTVGVREIRCTSGELGRFSRTFGRNFHP